MTPSSANQDAHASTPRAAVSLANCASAARSAFRSEATSTPCAQAHATVAKSAATRNLCMLPPYHWREGGGTVRAPDKEDEHEDARILRVRDRARGKRAADRCRS